MKSIAPSIALLALGLAACDDRPKHWNAYVYPDFEGSEEYETIAGFKSLEYCRWTATKRIEQLRQPEKADYECGYMCRYDPQMQINVCKETKK